MENFRIWYENWNIGYHYTFNQENINNINKNGIIVKPSGHPDFTIGFWVIRKSLLKARNISHTLVGGGYGNNYVAVDLSNLNILKFNTQPEFEKFIGSNSLANHDIKSRIEIKNKLLKQGVDAIEFGRGFGSEDIYKQGYIIIVNTAKIKIIESGVV